MVSTTLGMSGLAARKLTADVGGRLSAASDTRSCPLCASSAAVTAAGLLRVWRWRAVSWPWLATCPTSSTLWMLDSWKGSWLPLGNFSLASSAEMLKGKLPWLMSWTSRVEPMKSNDSP